MIKAIKKYFLKLLSLFNPFMIFYKNKEVGSKEIGYLEDVIMSKIVMSDAIHDRKGVQKVIDKWMPKIRKMKLNRSEKYILSSTLMVKK